MEKTHIVTISDTHNRHRQLNVPDGDIIIHAGDFTSRGYKNEIEDFLDWFGSLPHTWKILIAGNHDKGTDPDQTHEFYKGIPEYFQKFCDTENIILLNDDSCDIWDNNGNIIKIWGSPVQPTFGYNWAWNRNRGEAIKKHWDKIPNDIDIIVTHGPPWGWGDRVVNRYSGGERVGCEELMDAINRTSMKMHVCGHIHEDRGVFINEKAKRTFVNTSSLTLRYEPYLDKCFRFEWEKVKNCESEGRDYD